MLVFSLEHIGFAIGPALGGWWGGVRRAWAEARQAAGSGLIEDVGGLLYPSNSNGTAKKARAAEPRRR